jgi:RNA polymerase sigma-70 factor (ECF subfamily)
MAPASDGSDLRQQRGDAAGSRMSYRLIVGGRDTEASPTGTGNRAAELAPSDPPSSLDAGVLADSVLMRAVADGDSEAFARLIRVEAPRLTRFVAAMLSNLSEAEEVVQESLIRLWKGAGEWQPNGRIGTFLHQVAYRLSIDRIRRRRPHIDIDTLENQLEDWSPTPEHGLVRADDVRRVHEALDQLPERQRAAIVLAHFQELGQTEAAASMALSEHAYESLLARGRRRLRVLLAGQGEGDREEWSGS